MKYHCRVRKWGENWEAKAEVEKYSPGRVYFACGIGKTKDEAMASLWKNCKVAHFGKEVKFIETGLTIFELEVIE